MSLANFEGQRTPKCSNCNKPILSIEPSLMPFCSQRCKELDLSNWLTESYGMPFESDASTESADFSPYDDEDQ
ncbi:MAG: DNA gyrase inhibitor YacG [Planctomycetaceae bacterium]|nr:DNA gyrase inhibitor YacG [Planctomycetaceae bacterium]